MIEPAGWTCGQIRRQRADLGSLAEGGQQAETIKGGAAEYRHLAGPWLRIGGDQWLVSRGAVGQLRQVEKQHLWRAEIDRTRQRGGAGGAGRQIIDRAVLAPGLNAARPVVRHRDQPELGQPPIMIEMDHVAGIERQQGGRQFEDGTFAPGPCFHQPPAPRL